MAFEQTEEEDSVLAESPELDPALGLASVNEVWLVGRLSDAPSEREMPSGDTLVTFRVIVSRIDPGNGKPVQRRRQRVDALECHTWDPQLQRRLVNWCADDVVEVRGALRRRFYRGAQGTQSVTEVEVFRGKLIRRARTG